MAINKRAVRAADAGEKFIAKAEGGEHAVRWVRATGHRSPYRSRRNCYARWMRSRSAGI